MIYPYGKPIGTVADRGKQKTQILRLARIRLTRHITSQPLLAGLKEVLGLAAS